MLRSLTGRHVELGILVAFCIFLPLIENLKNIAWALYIVCWLVNRFRAREWGGRWDAWDSLIALWMASGFVVAAFVQEHRDEWHGAVDIVRYGAVLWLTKRARYSAAEIRLVLAALVASTLAGLAIGYYRLWSGIGKSGTLQLHSVGHVNHTAIYLAIMLGLCVAWLLASWQAARLSERVALVLVNAIVLASLIVTSSRGAIAVGLALLPLLGAGWWPRSPRGAKAAMAVASLVVAAAVGLNFDVVRKHEDNVVAKNMLSFRDGIWRMGMVGFRHNPWFGVGIDNYELVTPERVKGWLAREGKTYDPAQYVHFPHAHNLFINTLVERGLFGFLVLAAVLAAWLAAVLRRPPPRADDLDWTLWVAAFGAWFVTVAVGLVNTTLHHEHGILAVLFLGLWLARRNEARAS